MRQPGFIVLQQLNHSQWYAITPEHGGGGVGNYVQAMADALVWADLRGHAILVTDLDGRSVLALHADPASFEGVDPL